MIPRLHWKQGFTFVELLFVIVLVSILVTLFFPMYSYLRDKARNGACVNNLRVLQIGVATYMLDHEDVWPQMPEDVNMGESEEPMWEWWYKELKDYGVSKRHWVCPSELASKKQQDSMTEEFYGSYIPTSYDATPRIALMWGSQPWFLERGQFHGDDKGPNIALPNGSVVEGPALFGMPPQ
jgi:prepilin-type N-terminal cleavage/methylation domain-containing protein